MDISIQKTVNNVLAQIAPGAVSQGYTKSFQQLVRSIGEAKTKHEEERIVKRESATLKERISARDVSSRQMREYLIRVIYCEMLGVECSWGYIHAVKFTQSTNINDKRIGYLASSLFLHEDHELNMLLINSIQRDLRSSNMLDVSMALVIISRLIGEEMIPPLLPLVREKLKHPKELVRKKALLALHHFYRSSPSSVSHLKNDIRHALSDPDPGVMEAALVLLTDVIKDEPHKNKDLTSPFLNILSQVINRRLPSQFEYHSVPAPWIQIRLLRILAVLGADDIKKSEEMYSVIELALASAECNSNIGQAITYECIRTITSIYYHPPLVQKAANSVARFLVASNNNWKYLGINALASLVQIEPKYALDHQMIVIDCLDDPDETLKRKTLDLLYTMTNPANLIVITEKMIAYLRKTSDEFVKVDLVTKITELAEKFAPDNSWFIECMNSVFELGGDFVRREVAHNMMRIIAEGTEDDSADEELRRNAVISYTKLLDQSHLPDILIKIICWVIGEYAYVLGEDYQMEELLEKITKLTSYTFTDPRTLSWVFNCITRLIALMGYIPEHVHSQVVLHYTSEDTEVQQRCSELIEFSSHLQLMQRVLPLDSSCEDLNVDSSLSFLDNFVSQALVNGAPPYKPPHLRLTENFSNPSKVPKDQPSIKFQPYALPVKTVPSMTTGSLLKDSPQSTPAESREFFPSNNDSITTNSATTITNTPPSSNSPSLPFKLKSERKWTKEGYQKNIPPSPVVTENVSVSLESSVNSSVNSSVTAAEEKNKDVVSSTKENPTEAVPKVSQEELKKKTLASALFTGFSEPSAAGKRQQIKSKDTQQRYKRELPHPPPNDNNLLLLDLQDLEMNEVEDTLLVNNESSTTITTTTTTTAATTDITSGSRVTGTVGTTGSAGPTTGSTSLFDDVLLINSADHNPSQQESSTNNLHDLVDLFDVSSVPPASMAPPLLPSSSASPYDALIDSTPPTNHDLLINPLSTGGNLPSELSGLPIAYDWDKKEVISDGYIRLSISKVLRPADLILACTLTNQKQYTMNSVTINFKLSSNFKANVWNNSTDTNINWSGNIDGFSNCSHIVSLIPQGPAMNMIINGELLYEDDTKSQRRLFFDVQLQPSDFIRTLNITTGEFGQKWSTFSNDKKFKVMSSYIKDPQTYMNVISDKVHLHPVEIIGVEGIAAGTFIPNTTCFVHCKVAPPQLDVWIRSTSKVLPDVLAKELQLVLK